MSRASEIGEISVETGSHIEWTIKDIFSYNTADIAFNSPRFHVSHIPWYLQIYPNGTNKHNSVGWIALYLCSKEDSSAPPAGATYTFGVKRADGTVEQLWEDISWLFDDADGYGVRKLLQRSVLLSRRAELAPSDTLTLTCSLRVLKNLDCSSASPDPLSRDFLNIFTSKIGCDATLKVTCEEFQVHKSVLSARSPVFAAMFDHDMKEKNTRVVDIVDCDPRAFKDFLVYLYSGKTENLTANAFELFRIADKYDVKELKSDCLIHIMGNLSLENVCDAVTLADQFSVQELEFKTQEFFNKNFSEIVVTEKWKSLIKSDGLLANELLIEMGSEMKIKK